VVAEVRWEGPDQLLGGALFGRQPLGGLEIIPQNIDGRLIVSRHLAVLRPARLLDAAELVQGKAIRRGEGRFAGGSRLNQR
jgi:hypothetical protein